MSVKKKKEPTTEQGKSLSTQLSDLRADYRALRKSFSGQQAQINELQEHLKQLHEKIGV